MDVDLVISRQSCSQRIHLRFCHNSFWLQKHWPMGGGNKCLLACSYPNLGYLPIFAQHFQWASHLHPGILDHASSPHFGSPAEPARWSRQLPARCKRLWLDAWCWTVFCWRWTCIIGNYCNGFQIPRLIFWPVFRIECVPATLGLGFGGNLSTYERDSILWSCIGIALYSILLSHNSHYQSLFSSNLRLNPVLWRPGDSVWKLPAAVGNSQRDPDEEMTWREWLRPTAVDDYIGVILSKILEIFIIQYMTCLDTGMNPIYQQLVLSRNWLFSCRGNDDI